MPKLSVIVAAQDASACLRKCLVALTRQSTAEETEIIVPLRTNGHLTALTAEFPSVRFLADSRAGNVPRLWSAGMRVAQGQIVALTIENCIPAPDWAARVMASHTAAAWPAIGGAIEPDPAGSLATWAIYFCRYSNSMLPFPARFLDDLAADNCSYKRDALRAVEPVAANGFWETLVHEDMRRRGEKLFSDPALVVTFSGGISGWRFLCRRYGHGRYFAARRSVDFSFRQRLVRVLGAPVVPLLLLNRIAGRVRRKRRYGGKFLSSLPLIACFLFSWAAGEAVGYAAGYPNSSGPLE